MSDKETLNLILQKLDSIESKVDYRNTQRSQRELNRSLRKYAMKNKGDPVAFVASRSESSGAKSLKELLE